MRRAFLLALMAPLAACGKRRSKPKPTPGPADYTPPSWTVHLDVDPRVKGPVPTATEFEATMARACRLILDDARARSGGTYRPPAMPRGHHDVTIRLEQNCSTSGESSGIGTYGMAIKAQRCDGTPVDRETMLSWCCHRLGHVAGDFSGGNAAHSRMAAVLGC